MTPILEVCNLNKSFEIKKTFTSYFSPSLELHALRDINFSLMPNETLGIVGESGCGKSTLAKVLTQLETPTSGEMRIDGVSYDQIPAKDFHSLIQMVFQDPYQSLNPRKKALDIIADPLKINTNKTNAEIEHLVYEMMRKVGLREEFAKRYPHHFSGGQRQRIGIARALMLQPKVLILDEPVSALDVSIQAQVLNLLMDLQKEFKLSYLFISHDLSVIGHVSDRIMVMYLGKIVEYGTRENVFKNPQHPYTKILLESAPHFKNELTVKDKTPFSLSLGEMPSPLNLPPGCSFSSRCPIVQPSCKTRIPSLELKENRMVACFEVLSRTS